MTKIPQPDIRQTTPLPGWPDVRENRRPKDPEKPHIGREVQIRLYADWVEVYYKGHFVERMERVRGDGEVNVNYRHVINSLVRKPGAFARYRFREQLFPTMRFRLAYDALKQWRGERADVEYVRILHLAAQTMEANVDSALSLLLETGQPFDYGEVRELAEPKAPEAPALVLSGKPDLKIYDRLLRNWCHRTGERYRQAAIPLSQLRSAISALWLTHPPPSTTSQLNSG